MLLATRQALHKAATRRAATPLGRRFLSQSLPRKDGRYPMLPQVNNYDAMYDLFRWNVPKHFNVGVDVCDKHVINGYGDDLAMIAYQADATSDKNIDNEKNIVRYTFKQLKQLSDKLANGLLHGCHLNRGEAVAIYLAQSAETGISHIAIPKAGLVALPLFTQFGEDAVLYRMQNSGAAAIITDMQGLQVILKLKGNLPNLKSVIVVRPRNDASALPKGVFDFYSLIEKSSSTFQPINTRTEDPALIIYTSGTTGNPKGCIHAHRVLIGHTPGVEASHNFFPKQNDLFWTPADWAWIGGLLDVVLPSWSHRIPVLAYRMKKFDPDFAFYLMAKHKIKNTFMPPTALKFMRQVSEKTIKEHKTELRTIGSGGESVGTELYGWCLKVFGVKINEFYGQTECNLVLSNVTDILNPKIGSLGKPVPGHKVSIVTEDGEECGVGEVGNIAVHRPDPVMFLEYHNNPQATKKKFAGEWLLTGDLGKRDEDGYFWFVGRDDDIIKSSGYRIGPGEIEDCLIKHDKVAAAAVVGKPDKERGELVKAFVVLSDKTKAPENKQEEEALIAEIQAFVKTRLAHYEYPREIEFIRELPTTTTGKVIRKALKQKEIQKQQQQELDKSSSK